MSKYLPGIVKWIFFPYVCGVFYRNIIKNLKIMKKIIRYFLALPVLAVILTSCGKEDEKTTLSLSTGELEFGYDEVRVDKTVTVTTNAATFEINVVYDDPQNAEWLDAVKEGNDIKAAVVERNMDPEEQHRTATIKVTAGEVTEEIEVTQLSYIETDFSIVMSSETLSFAATGNYLTKEITAITKVMPIDADVDVEWITALDTEGDTVTVTVAENDGDDRDATVTVTNERGGSTTFKVIQYGKPSVDLAGTWTWSSISAPSDTADGWAESEGLSGEATIELIDGGYTVRGIKGIGLTMVNILTDNPDLAPEMHLRLEGDQLFVGINSETSTEPGLEIPLDPAFAVGETKYYSAKSLHFEEVDTPVYTALDFPLTVLNEEVDGVIYEKLIFPTEYSNDPKNEGQTAEVSYIYYTYLHNPRTGTRYTTVDFHRNVILTRTIEQ